jgi:hypothetical protein
MLVFIDESGDTGLKIEKGSSKYFVIVLVSFEENEEAIACDQRIKLLKRELKMPEGFEFKFSKLRKEQRIKFFESVLPYSFFYFGIVINIAVQIRKTRALTVMNLKEHCYAHEKVHSANPRDLFLKKDWLVICNKGYKATNQTLI